METAKQKWIESMEIEAIANSLINQFHSHLATVPIKYFFFDKEIVQGDKQIWGRARKISGINAVLANDGESDQQFFVIEIWKFIWDSSTEKQRRALVDHELEHCWADENGKLSILKHDLEEFTSIVKRHGLWRTSIQLFVDAANGLGQQDLFQSAEPDPEEEDVIQTAFPLPGRAPLQLAAAPTNALSDGSTAMPGASTAPRQLTSGTHAVKCPHCNQFGDQVTTEINAWLDNEIDLQCPHCTRTFDSSHLNSVDAEIISESDDNAVIAA